MEDALVWTWDTLRKKNQTRATWFECYGNLIPVCLSNAEQFKGLCQRERDWSGVSEQLRSCTDTRLGSKLFAGLEMFVMGARVARDVKAVLDKWQAAKTKITSDEFKQESQRLSDMVARWSNIDCSCEVVAGWWVGRWWVVCWLVVCVSVVVVRCVVSMCWLLLSSLLLLLPALCAPRGCRGQLAVRRRQEEICGNLVYGLRHRGSCGELPR